MKSFFTALFLLAAVCSAVNPNPKPQPEVAFKAASRSAGDCDFEICGVSTAVLSKKASPMTDEVCRRSNGRLVRRIERTGEAKVQLAGSSEFKKISEIPFNGQNVYPPIFFSEIPANGFRTDATSALEFDGNVPRPAIEALGGASVRLPILRWINAAGNAVRETDACVAFDTIAAKVEIRLSWFSADDFDLSVQEPDGSVVDFRRNGGCGNLLADRTSICGSPNREGRVERIVYSVGSDCPSGVYKVIPRVWSNCDTSTPTRYNLQIIKDGQVIFDVTNFANNDNDTPIPGVMPTFVL